jgi:hypothetical protein
VILIKVLTEPLKLLTLHMDELAALLALAMEADLRTLMTVLAHEFKACRTVTVNDILPHYTFVYQTFQLSVHSCLSYGLSLALQVLANVTCGYMPARYGLQIFHHYLSLPGLICHICLRSQNNEIDNHSQIIFPNIINVNNLHKKI